MSERALQFESTCCPLQELREATEILAIPSVSYGSAGSNFFHFVMGVLLPVVELRAKKIARRSQKIIVPSHSSFDRLLGEASRAIGPIESTQMDPRGSRHLPVISLDSFDPFQAWKYGLPLYRPTALIRGRLRKSVSYLRHHLPRHPGFSVESDVVIVDRMQSPRAGIDFEALQGRLSDAGMAVERVMTEDMSLEHQVELFRHTGLVIAQHGAALANLVWTANMISPPAVIEITPASRENAYYYELLATSLKCLYHRVRQNGDEITEALCTAVSWRDILASPTAQ